MTETADNNPVPLPPRSGGLKAAFSRPKWVAGACVVALTGLGWLYLGALIAGMGGTLGALGPGMSAFDYLPRVLTVVCQPTFGIALMPDGTSWGASGLALVLLMWMAMALAMMLPSAGPMILTYAEIAETAARKGERIVSPFVLTAGYAVVWFAFALVASIAQYVFTRPALLDASMASASSLFSGAIFIGAGFYQFSTLKHACLTQCRSPFPFFFTRWETKARGVFKLGLEQGVFCLGCCWAMMLVMFAVGVMNVVWMAALGVIMTVEKMLSGNRFTHVLGVMMIVIGVALVGMSIAAHWPGLHV